jgi:hypothetical protein
MLRSCMTSPRKEGVNLRVSATASTRQKIDANSVTRFQIPLIVVHPRHLSRRRKQQSSRRGLLTEAVR